ncbi:MAG TPA: DUF2147 domain-containing protein [Hellea balneolensis]|uniref:DUF2147 domain-containing protein n=1 Tax=Hellea balneolensis TaxID=287478 RepID=A0A7C5LY69_9PROT|nr:DUF2147 domain-containing protein [Hellea balneolensis]
MTLTKKILLGAAALTMTATTFAGSAFADEADKALGVWLRPKFGWHVEFALCEGSTDTLCGTVISGEGVDKKTQGPVVGVKMLFDLKKNKKGTKWKGKMYDPKGGGTYSGSVKVLDDGRVKMAGCMAKIMCRSEKWVRVK